MSYFHATWWLTKKLTVRGSGTPHPSLYIEPEGTAGGYITLQMDRGLTSTERVAVADQVLSAVTRWRDALAAEDEQERTAADELAAAHAEIARLKAEAEGTS
jgi:hypothetical protein